jgi:hypothetical protein
MPALFNYFEELANVDWSTVVIYTCKNSCTTNGGYVKEFAYVEFDEDLADVDV